MAYSYETSSVKTINGEVSGLADVVARQAIANLPTLSGGEGIQIVNEDGKNRIDLGLSAGSNMSFVYDQETNTIRLDAEGGTGGIDWTTGAGLSAIVQTSSNDIRGFTNMFGMFQSGDGGLLVSSCRDGYNSYWTVVDDESIIGKHIEGNDTNYYFSNYYLGNQGVLLSAGTNSTSRKEFNTYRFNSQGLSYNSTVSATWGPTTSNTTTWTWNDIDYLKSNSANYYTKTDTSSKQEISAALQYISSSAGKTYTGVDPIQVNNSTNEISITGETLSAGPGINIFESGGYVVISAGNDDYNFFPMTGTDGITNYTANANFSSFTLTTGQGAAGAHVNMNVKGVHFEAYPATDVSASWYNIITQQDKITCSSVKLTTAASENWFYTSAVPNLNKITFIAPTYGPYETYSALIDDGNTTFVAEVDSGCCVTVVRCWNDDRNKDCWCGLNQETYFYIG